MIKDDNSGGDELQFDDIDSMLASESSSELNGLEDLSIDSDPLESIVASSGEEYPSSFENDFYFHPEETDPVSSNPSLEDLELTDPIVDVEIEKLLDTGDFVDLPTSNISNLESDDSFFNPGDSAPDEGMDFSELDNYLTEESDAIDFGEESDNIEEFDPFDQDKEENISSHEDDFLNEEGSIALPELKEIVSADEPLPSLISPSLGSEEENITLSDSELDGILEGEELPETDAIFGTTFDESEEDDSIAFSGSEPDDILMNTTTDESTVVTNSMADDDLPDFITHTDLDENEEPVDSSIDFEPETTSFEAEDNEPIALSDEELGNLLASENEEPVDSSINFEPETTSFEAEDNEPIALSDEELGNLLASENEEPVDSSINFEPETTSFESEDSEPIALSDEELGNLLASENEEPVDSSIDFEPETTSFEAEDNEPIALSDEELGNLLASENEEPVDSSINFEPETTSFESEDSEPIALSDEELGNLLASENEEPVDSSINFEPETTSFEAEDNEPIALSLDELDHILTDDEESNVSENTLEEFPGSEMDWDSPVSEQTEEDAIALSEEELGDLLSDDSGTGALTETDGFENDLLGGGELPKESMFEENSLPVEQDLGGPDEFGLEEEALSDSSFDFEPETISFESEGEDEESIALSEEELGNLLSSDEEETPSSSLFDETSLQEEDSISLPVDELDDIGDIQPPQEDFLALENFDLSTGDFEPTQTLETTSFESEDNEPIALSLDELDHILTDDEESNVSENTLEEFPGSEMDWDPPVSEQTEEHTTALSEEELLEDSSATVKEKDLSEILGELPPTSDLDAFDSIDDDVSKENVSQVAPTEGAASEDEMIIVLDEYAEEEKSSPIEELRKTPDQEETSIKEGVSGETPSKEEMKRIMTYLDELLGNLPDDLIREFSRSDYFELYKKLMKQIGV
ncbi:hypothetical protein LEP1GSC125_2178 [Leptospira mayottensis 200901122]|uniref:Uncharacterized protein n=1 Tax=Leptospira mayottensis 200901122 TaxID=1193010 RepID=A0AA87SY14_9LEPT|nr:hypothetical protein [Leptospira mayottensis]EKS00786.1 hypothetical protein LEP1GSC125_2178 [Leptospira mayottensis 200901122]